MQNHSRSPVRPINNQRGNNNNAAANLFEFPNAPTTTNSGASITVNWIFKKIIFEGNILRDLEVLGLTLQRRE